MAYKYLPSGHRVLQIGEDIWEWGEWAETVWDRAGFLADGCMIPAPLSGVHDVHAVPGVMAGKVMRAGVIDPTYGNFIVLHANTIEWIIASPGITSAVSKISAASATPEDRREVFPTQKGTCIRLHPLAST